MRQLHWEEAAAHIENCLAAWPRDPDVRLAAARIARMNGKLPAAEALLTQSLKLQGHATEAIQLEFLLLRVQLGELDAVAPGLLEAVEQRPSDAPLILMTLSQAYMHNMRYRPALLCLNRWKEIEPDSALVHQSYGWVLERINNTSAALKAYERAIELDPGLIAVRLKIAEMLMAQSDVPEALPHLELLVRQHPDRADVKARMGECQLLLGRRAEARRYMEEALQHRPNDPSLLVHLAKLEMQEERPAQAEKHLRRVIERDSSDVEAHYALVSALRHQQRDQEADAALKKYERVTMLLELSNKLLKTEADEPTVDAAAPAQIGAALIEIGQERLGVYWLHEALRRDPNHLDSHRALAEYYERMRNQAQAAVHRRKIAELEGKSAAAP